MTDDYFHILIFSCPDSIRGDLLGDLHARTYAVAAEKVICESSHTATGELEYDMEYLFSQWVRGGCDRATYRSGRVVYLGKAPAPEWLRSLIDRADEAGYAAADRLDDESRQQSREDDD